MIEEYVASESCPNELKEEFEFSKKEAKEYEEQEKEEHRVKAAELLVEGKVMEAANMGNPEAMGRMARMFCDGNGVDVDKSRCYLFARKASNAGDMLGRFLLARCYHRGWGGVEVDWGKALNLYMSCADEFPKEANHNMGNICRIGAPTFVQDLLRAAGYYRLAANSGSANSQFNLANQYYRGHGVERNLAEARKLYKMAAELQYVNAIFYYGRMVMNGEGGERQKSAGVALLRKAAAHGNKQATFDLAKRDGVVTKKYLSLKRKCLKAWSWAAVKK